MAQYWPDDEEPKQQHGPLDISIVSTDTFGPVIMREFHVSLVKKVNNTYTYNTNILNMICYVFIY